MNMNERKWMKWDSRDNLSTEFWYWRITKGSNDPAKCWAESRSESLAIEWEEGKGRTLRPHNAPEPSAIKFWENYWWYMPIMPTKIMEAEARRYLGLAGHPSQPYSENPRPVRDPIWKTKWVVSELEQHQAVFWLLHVHTHKQKWRLERNSGIKPEKTKGKIGT